MAKKLPTSRHAELQRILSLPEPDIQAETDIDIAISEVVAPEEWKNGFGAMSPPRRRYLACNYLVTEVNNGGFHQFLSNKGPDVAREALAFLDQRGFDNVASLLRRIIDALPGGKLPGTHEELDQLLDAEETFELCDGIDSEYFENDPSPELVRELLRYVDENADEFFA